MGNSVQLTCWRCNCALKLGDKPIDRYYIATYSVTLEVCKTCYQVAVTTQGGL
jgi:hypothetical protein